MCFANARRGEVASSNSMTTRSFNWVGMNRSKGGQRDGDDGVARRRTGPKRVGANIGTKSKTMEKRRVGAD